VVEDRLQVLVDDSGAIVMLNAANIYVEVHLFLVQGISTVEHYFIEYRDESSNDRGEGKGQTHVQGEDEVHRVKLRKLMVKKLVLRRMRLISVRLRRLLLLRKLMNLM